MRILEGLNILLVEEEPLIALDIEQLCYDYGAAKVEALNSLAEITPGALDAGDLNAAVLDVKVGDEWTTDFARRLVERRIPFIFATGYTDAEPFFAEFPEIAVIPKPYAGIELAEALASAMHRARSGDG